MLAGLLIAPTRYAPTANLKRSQDRANLILGLMEDDDSEEVRDLLQYEEDTAGGIMTPDVITLQEGQTVAAALDAIAYVDTHEPFLHAFTIDAEGKPAGYVSIWELLREREREVHDFTAIAEAALEKRVRHAQRRFIVVSRPPAVEIEAQMPTRLQVVLAYDFQQVVHKEERA